LKKNIFTSLHPLIPHVLNVFSHIKIFFEAFLAFSL